ncbi:MAG: flagellar FlbD family protein [Candidatus Latescibacteria bacterium]|jgi:flagellar protein FlbD|nr:flagellar FlbD family protein [Candidatus Latescibacterota bacterium]
MIKLTRLNNTMFIVNADLIEIIEATPDTIISLTTGHKFLVKESVDEVIKKVTEFKHNIFYKSLVGE